MGSVPLSVEAVALDGGLVEVAGTCCAEAAPLRFDGFVGEGDGSVCSRSFIIFKGLGDGL